MTLASNKYDVLLIYPKSENVNILIPLSLLSLCGPLVKNNYKVKIIDQRIEQNFFEKIDEILENGVVCVGITFSTGNQIKYACEIMDYIKEKYPSTKIVVGGFHSSLLPHQTIEYKNIDIVVVGEGEKTFFELVESLKKNKSLKEVRGIVFKENGEIIETPKQEAIDVNEYYEIPYYLLKNYIGNYSYCGLIYSSRGCPLRCSFCSITLIYPKWVALKPELVIEQIKELLKLGVTYINFVDDDFFVDLKRVEEILDLKLKEKIFVNWRAQCRIDYVLKMSDEFLAKLKKCGLDVLYVGAESGSDRILKLMDKNINVDMIKKVNLRLKKFGIIPEFSFMAGFPSETEEDFEKTNNLIKQLKVENPKSSIWKINTCSPYPGTKLFEIAVEEGFVPPKSLKEWSKIDWYRNDYKINYDIES
jgi:radical SAM superfamily enzyme YgiQ (UPF0313 family)